jgi:hypothetical protein
MKPVKLLVVPVFLILAFGFAGVEGGAVRRGHIAKEAAPSHQTTRPRLRWTAYQNKFQQDMSVIATMIAVPVQTTLRFVTSLSVIVVVKARVRAAV